MVHFFNPAPLAGDVARQPVQAFVQALARRRARALNVPVKGSRGTAEALASKKHTPVALDHSLQERHVHAEQRCYCASVHKPRTGKDR